MIAVPAVSVLFSGSEPSPVLEREAPPFFGDLNLDQVVASITAGREEYDLAPFFYSRLPTLDAIAYRHEVLRDLESEALLAHIGSFAQEMREMRRHLAQAEKVHYAYEREAWFLDAAQLYSEAVEHLAGQLAVADLGSRGLRAFRAYLADYVKSDSFRTLRADIREVRVGLSEVRYLLTIKGLRVEVSRCGAETDYSSEVEQTFKKFKRAVAKDYRTTFSASPWMNHVEAGILDLVARLHPDVFSALDTFCRRHRDYLDTTIATFDREVQFYVAYLQYTERFRAAGLRFCYPRVDDRSQESHARDAFDVALADTLVPERPVVCNDLDLRDPERIIVVSGPNQGGKTTFARMFGQLHYLAAIGCPVPGSDAQLFLCDRLFTHFEREEDLSTLSGKLEDDLIRIHAILEQATPRSIVIMNESLTGTTLRDASTLGRAVLEQMIARRLICVYVTFVDELASLSPATVSMVSTVSPDDPATRTYKIVRRPADGLAYAYAIAEKHGLTYECLKERLTS